MKPRTKTRLGISALVYMAVNAVLFGAGLIVALMLAPRGDLFAWIAAVVIASFILAAPIAWWIAPRLRPQNWRRPEGLHSDPAR